MDDDISDDFEFGDEDDFEEIEEGDEIIHDPQFVFYTPAKPILNGKEINKHYLFAVGGDSAFMNEKDYSLNQCHSPNWERIGLNGRYVWAFGICDDFSFINNLPGEKMQIEFESGEFKVEEIIAMFGLEACNFFDDYTSQRIKGYSGDEDLPILVRDRAEKLYRGYTQKDIVLEHEARRDLEFLLCPRFKGEYQRIVGLSKCGPNKGLMDLIARRIVAEYYQDPLMYEKYDEMIKNLDRRAFEKWDLPII